MRGRNVGRWRYGKWGQQGQGRRKVRSASVKEGDESDGSYQRERERERETAKKESKKGDES
jgi:hypothetical protein